MKELKGGNIGGVGRREEQDKVMEYDLTKIF